MPLSPLELDFVVHYKMMDQESGQWDRIRILRLCNMMKLTMDEFARFIRLTPGQLERLIQNEKFPACIRLLLELVERSAHNAYLGQAHLKPLFPNYPDGRPANP